MRDADTSRASEGVRGSHPYIRSEAKMRLVAAAVVLLPLFSCSCRDDGPLSVVCPEQCYSGPEGTENVGACRPGVPICDETGLVLECVGETVPRPEGNTCDVIDDDCDGDVNDVHGKDPLWTQNSCAQCGMCAGTWERCDGATGRWYCDYPVGFPSPEVCDGTKRDEDCDCLTDGQDPDLPNSNNPSAPLEFCYTGPPETMLTGACKPGYAFCDPETGTMGCSDVTPSREDCSDIDRNCNGIPNDVVATYDKVNMVFGIDISASMDPFIRAVTNVVCQYAAQGGNEDFGFALVLIAEPDESFTLVQNMTDAAGLCTALGQIEGGGGREPTLSTAEAVADPNNPLLIAWDPGNTKRIFVGFGDEEAQATNNLVDQAVTDSLGFCDASQTDIYWFVGRHMELYTEQAFGCGGRTFPLTEYEPYLLDSLNRIVSSVCTGEGDDLSL